MSILQYGVVDKRESYLRVPVREGTGESLGLGFVSLPSSFCGLRRRQFAAPRALNDHRTRVISRRSEYNYLKVSRPLPGPVRARPYAYGRGTVTATTTSTTMDPGT